MKWYAASLFVAIGLVMAFMYWGINIVKEPTEKKTALAEPHVYGERDSIRAVDLLILYFVPKNKIPVAETLWKNLLLQQRMDLKSFHNLQFQGRSDLRVVIHPDPVIGRENNDVYDTNDTRYGNPAALRSIATEILARQKSDGGDLAYTLASFEGRQPILYILYEGVGAAGSVGAALLSRKFLSDPEYQSFNNALFAHEFYHTLGVPDSYTKEDISFSADLMGLGRRRPLESNFLDAKTLENMGL